MSRLKDVPKILCGTNTKYGLVIVKDEESGELLKKVGHKVRYWDLRPETAESLPKPRKTLEKAVKSFTEARRLESLADDVTPALTGLASIPKGLADIAPEQDNTASEATGVNLLMPEGKIHKARKGAK